ncbi:hypothetical protein ACWDV4_09820, partial [Micromonospora sp. NPDC003197]
MTELFSPPVVVCDHCEGLAKTLNLCRCVGWGDRFLIDTEADDQGADGCAYRGCELCGGSGYVAQNCSYCGRTGQRRAQLVLTVVNVDTAAAHPEVGTTPHGPVGA